LAVLLILTAGSSGHDANSQERREGQASKNILDVNIAIGSETPHIIDPFLRVETVAEGLEIFEYFET
jgi:hypothetical protein